MGYRRAAMRRRPQYVSSHWRRSKNGNYYKVSGHARNAPLYEPNEPAFVIGMVIAGFFTFGITWIALVAYFIITAKN